VRALCCEGGGGLGEDLFPLETGGRGRAEGWQREIHSGKPAGLGLHVGSAHPQYSPSMEAAREEFACCGSKGYLRVHEHQLGDSVRMLHGEVDGKRAADAATHQHHRRADVLLPVRTGAGRRVSRPGSTVRCKSMDIASVIGCASLQARC
jgi:hypothetical protein